MKLNTIINTNCLTGLSELTSDSIDMCVTSPPYYGLRDYGHEDQLGLEETPEAYIENMVKVFRELKRVLKPEGTLWLNIGDSYAGSGKGIGDNTGDKWKQSTHRGIRKGNLPKAKTFVNIKPKDLIGIPWMLAFALRADGWYLRQDIIWHKPNPMPESVTDRCTKAHEYIFLLSKSKKYYFDHEAIMEPIKDASIRRLIQDIEQQEGSSRVPGKSNGNMKAVRFGGNKYGDNDDPKYKTKSGKGWMPKRKGDSQSDKIGLNGSNFKHHKNFLTADGELLHGSMANKRSVWTVTTKPFKEAHFATFPEDLISPCILSGCPEDGIVLDPFMGSGTTALVARKLNRNYIGFELNKEYIKIANRRMISELGLFNKAI
jgi:DNA modification methylase